MLLAFGILCAMLEAQKSGKGQVVDASMVEGSAILSSMFYGFYASGMWSDNRGTNLLDGGAHFYGTYETADKKYVSIGSIEPQFYELLKQHAELTDAEFNQQMDPREWPKLKEKLVEVFKTKTRDEWCEIMEGTDVCFAPVLTFGEAADHPHNKARESFIELDGVIQPAPAPKFSRTKPNVPTPPASPGEHTEAILKDWGFQPDEIESLQKSGAI